MRYRIGALLFALLGIGAYMTLDPGVHRDIVWATNMILAAICWICAEIMELKQ